MGREKNRVDGARGSKGSAEAVVVSNRGAASGAPPEYDSTGRHAVEAVWPAEVKLGSRAGAPRDLAFLPTCFPALR